MKILVTPTSLQPGKNSRMLSELEKFSKDLVFNPADRPLTEDELIPLLRDCDGYIAGLDFITEKVLNSCPKLKAISRYGAGCDRVDIKVATANNIAVTNTPGVNAQAVGELSFALALSVARKIPYLDRMTRDGKWVRSMGIELAGKTMGIIGLGAIGKVVAKCAQGFSMKVISYDSYTDKSYCEENNIIVATFEEVIRESDVISLHLPLNSDTKHLIDREAIRQMKNSAIIINTSRGGIIDEEAAYEALSKGMLGGMGVDVFEKEPPENSKLLKLDNVVATPHTGAHTKEAADNMAGFSIRNLVEVLLDKECEFVVNKK
ncbi:MAG: phosphoglycerate dehydrogenase [Anaerocolumna sp.]